MSKKKKKVVKKNNTKKARKKRASIKKKNIQKKVNTKRTTAQKKVTNKLASKPIKNALESVLEKEDLSKKEIIKEEIELIKKDKTITQYLKEKKNLIRLLCILVLVILIVILLKPEKNIQEINFNEVDITEYMNLYKSEKLEYIFITDEDCLECNDAKKRLDKLEKDYSIKINELNINNLSKEDIKKLQESNSSLKDNIDVPSLISIKKGLEIGKINVKKEYSALKKFVEYSSNPTTVNSFTKISVNKYLSLLKSDKITVIYIGSHTNSECRKFSTILESVSQELNFKVNYLDTDLISKSEDWELLNNSNKIFEDNWFMPAILIVKKGNIVGYKMESLEKEVLYNFFNKYDL